MRSRHVQTLLRRRACIRTSKCTGSEPDDRKRLHQVRREDLQATQKAPTSRTTAPGFAPVQWLAYSLSAGDQRMYVSYGPWKESLAAEQTFPGFNDAYEGTAVADREACERQAAAISPRSCAGT